MTSTTDQVKRLIVEAEAQVKQMPTPNSMKAAALTAAELPRWRYAKDYGESVHILRGKGYTWDMVADWFEERGASYRASSLKQAYRQWCHEHNEHYR